MLITIITLNENKILIHQIEEQDSQQVVAIKDKDTLRTQNIKSARKNLVFSLLKNHDINSFTNYKYYWKITQSPHEDNSDLGNIFPESFETIGAAIKSMKDSGFKVLVNSQEIVEEQFV